MRVHRLTVDAYAAQHPGKAERRRSIQSVWVHFAGLHLVLEKCVPDVHVRRVLTSVNEDTDRLTWLAPPERYASTISDVVGASDAVAHGELVRRWAEDVWQAWACHHVVVRSLVEKQLARM